MNTDSRKLSDLHAIMQGKSPFELPPEEGVARKSILEDRIVEYNSKFILSFLNILTLYYRDWYY